MICSIPVILPAPPSTRCKVHLRLQPPPPTEHPAHSLTLHLLLTLRVNRAEAEEQRWRTLEIQHQMETQRMANMRDHGTAARSNKSSMPYNPISLRYDDGSDGDRLRYADESLRYRSALRADHLQQRMTSTGFNPITGEAYNKVPIPAAPTRPNC